MAVSMLENADREGRQLLSSAQADWARPVPTCPGWDCADLVRHTGGVLAWIATIVSDGEHISRRDLPPTPAANEQLPDWYSAQLDNALTALNARPAGVAVWTFSTLGNHRVGWWRRRIAVELALHRYDAQTHPLVNGTSQHPEPIATEVAEAGIDEFVTEFLPGC